MLAINIVALVMCGVGLVLAALAIVGSDRRNDPADAVVVGFGWIALVVLTAATVALSLDLAYL